MCFRCGVKREVIWLGINRFGWSQSDQCIRIRVASQISPQPCAMKLFSLLLSSTGTARRTAHDPACWEGFQYEECCGPWFGPYGNASCWDQTFTPQRCCREEYAEKTLHKEPCQCCNRTHELAIPKFWSISASVQKEGVPIFFDALTPWAEWLRKVYPKWEPDTFEVFRRMVPGRYVLDIGAWIGWAVVFSHAFRHSCFSRSAAVRLVVAVFAVNVDPSTLLSTRLCRASGPTVLWSANFAKHVFAVEPAPTAYCQLVANLNSNPLFISSRVSAVHAALHRSQGQTLVV